jgi:Domain of unknown function DUF29
MATSARAKPPTPPRTRYEDDLYTWVEEQVELLRAGRLSEIDARNIAEELGDVGNEQLDKLESSIEVLTQHLLKWDHQPQRRSRSWELSIREQRRRIVRVLKKNPGLKPQVAEAIVEGYADGRDRAAAEMDISFDILPDLCPFSFDEMMTRPIVYAPKPKSRKR